MKKAIFVTIILCIIATISLYGYRMYDNMINSSKLEFSMKEVLKEEFGIDYLTYKEISHELNHTNIIDRLTSMCIDLNYKGACVNLYYYFEYNIPQSELTIHKNLYTK